VLISRALFFFWILDEEEEREDTDNNIPPRHTLYTRTSFSPKSKHKNHRDPMPPPSALVFACKSGGALLLRSSSSSSRVVGVTNQSRGRTAGKNFYEPMRRRRRRRHGGIAVAASDEKSERNDALGGERSDEVVDVAERREEEEEKEIVVDDDDASMQQFLIENLISSPLFYVTFGVAGGVYLTQKFGSNASLLFSALPIVLLTYISKSDFGKTLQEAARKAREADEGGEEGGREGRERRRALAKAKFPTYFGEERGRWLPRSLSLAPSDALFPSYLDGTLAGDAQFDPLRLSDTEEKRRRNVELELLHGRWAMLAVVGVCVPEILSRSGALELSEPIWWKIGEKVLEGIDVNYLGIDGFHIAGASGILGIAFCQAVLMGGPEYARYVGIESLEPVGVYLPGDTNYPGGGPFDPFKLSADAERDVELRVSEVKHGRLAMIAMLGVFAQAFVTREGPVANVFEFFS
jgi:light-harvesting complex II chlorophyll a/b binding protein 7